MNKQKLYVITLSAAFFVSLIGPRLIFDNFTIDNYMFLLIICYFGLTSIFRPKRHAPDLVGGVLLVTFVYFFLIKVLSTIG